MRRPSSQNLFKTTPQIEVLNSISISDTSASNSPNQIDSNRPVLIPQTPLPQTKARLVGGSPPMRKATEDNRDLDQLAEYLESMDPTKVGFENDDE